ncbi:hypothetical protein N7472_009844 [Penicillium cf. griseofulvum]|uniref:Uncharacterized protein n=1 Tax=Penicillium cf. griseofulvum TaxID=2972120 RepID=A0A9W9M1D0_9EURO|nr:hypothetical protein N7472_009844 [Penicillium cf. griseofulvum]
MKLPRSAWTWSAFQVDTALFMYGGVSTVAIPVEAIITPAPKIQVQAKKPEDVTLQDLLIWESALLPSTLAHRYEFARTWGDWGSGSRIDQNRRENPNNAYHRAPRCSITSSPGAHSQEFDPSIGAKPCSPFYPHSSPTISHEQLTFETKNANRRSHLRDLESMGPYASCRTDSPRRSKLWEEENKPLTWLQSLSNKQRMALKAVVAVVTVGTMIAIALGITAAVGGAGWRASAEKSATGG